MRAADGLRTRLAGFAIGAAIAFVVLAIQLPPLAGVWLALAIVSGLIGGILATTAFRRARGAVGDRTLRDRGLLARATVLAATPTGRTRGDETEVDLELEVLVPGRRRYVVRHREWLDPAARSRIAVGRPLPIAVDPRDPARVVLAFEHDVPDPRAIAGLGPFAGGPGGAAVRPAAERDDVSRRDPPEGEPAGDR